MYRADGVGPFDSKQLAAVINHILTVIEASRQQRGEAIEGSWSIRKSDHMNGLKTDEFSYSQPRHWIGRRSLSKIKSLVSSGVVV